MKRRPTILLERVRLERRWQKKNRRLADLRHGRRCAQQREEREGELLESLDVVEFQLGQLPDSFTRAWARLRGEHGAPDDAPDDGPGRAA